MEFVGEKIIGNGSFGVVYQVKYFSKLSLFQIFGYEEF